MSGFRLATLSACQIGRLGSRKRCSSRIVVHTAERHGFIILALRIVPAGANFAHDDDCSPHGPRAAGAVLVFLISMKASHPPLPFRTLCLSLPPLRHL